MIVKKPVEEVKVAVPKKKTYAEKKGIAVDNTGIKLNRPEPKGDTINRGHPSLKV